MRIQTLYALGVFLFVAVAAIFFVGYRAFVMYDTSNQPVVSDHLHTILVIENPPALDVVWQRFHGAMVERGYEDDKDVTYIVKRVGTNLSTTKNVIRTVLETEQVDLIYTMGILATRAAKEVTEEDGTAIPVVFAVVSDPVGGGLVASMHSSGNNVTGVTPVNDFVVLKRFEFLREALPDTKRVIYIWNDKQTSGIDAVKQGVIDSGLVFIEKYVESPSEFMAFLSSFPFQKNDVMIRTSDSVGATVLKETIYTTLNKEIPLIGTNQSDVTQGALLSYGANYGDIGAQSSKLVERVLQGESPAHIPLEDAENFELSINLDTAKILDITLPESILVKAHHILSEK